MRHELVLTFALIPCVPFSEQMYNMRGDLLLMLKVMKYFWQNQESFSVNEQNYVAGTKMAYTEDICSVYLGSRAACYSQQIRQDRENQLLFSQPCDFYSR